MKKSVLFLVVFLLQSSSLFAQTDVFAPFEVNGQKTNSMSLDIKNSVDDAKIVDVNFDVIKQIVSRKANSIFLTIPYSGISFGVTLKKFDILTPGSKIVSGTQSGDKRVDMNNSFVAYTSNLYDKNTPLVAVTFFENELSAMIISDEDTYVLSKLSNSNDYLLYRSSKIKKQHELICGSDVLGIPDRVTELQKNLSGNVRDYSTSQLLRAAIAIESDYDTYAAFGNSVVNASRYLLSLMVPVSAIYVRDINVQLQVTYLRVWDNPNDPYTGTTSLVLLNEFRNYWNANMSSVSRALAHYICTRPGGLGGIAWVDVLCANTSSGFGYAFSDVDGAFNPLPAYTWDVMVVSHETGHNFGSPHTHNCSWPGGPIDTCYVPVEGGCYNGPAITRVGTIMSYCHLNGSISLALGFGPLPTALIRGKAEAGPCMNNVTGFLVALPNGGEIYRSGNSMYIVWGTSFTGNVNIEYSINNGSSWSTVQNNVSAILRNVSFPVPYMSTTTQAKVRVYETGNPSNGDQSDSVFQIRPTIQPSNLIDPPQLYRVNVYPGDTSKINFTFSKSGTLPEFRYRWNLSTINNAFNYNQLSNNNGSDSIASISKGRLDSIMSAWGVVTGDSLRVKWFVKSYTMFDSSGSNNFLITFVRSIIGIQPVSQIIPKVYFVSPNYPNPFNPSTTIKFGLPKNSFVNISVYDILGRQVSVLVNEQLKAGEYAADWNASNFPSGVYFYKIEAGEFTKTSKMILVK